MAATAVNAWNTIKSRHEELTKDPKFKPDKLAPLCARLDADGNQLDKQEEEKKKAGKILDDSDAEIESFKSKITAKHDEIQQLTDEIEELKIEGDLTDDTAAKAISQLAASWVNLARQRSDAAQQVAKLSTDQASLVKKAADQFKAKMEGAIAAEKRAKADGTKTLDQIKNQVAPYQKVASGMKDSDMAADIGSLYSTVSQLYSF